MENRKKKIISILLVSFLTIIMSISFTNISKANYIVLDPDSKIIYPETVNGGEGELSLKDGVPSDAKLYYQAVKLTKEQYQGYINEVNARKF